MLSPTFCDMCSLQGWWRWGISRENTAQAFLFLIFSRTLPWQPWALTTFLDSAQASISGLCWGCCWERGWWSFRKLSPRSNRALSPLPAWLDPHENRTQQMDRAISQRRNLEEWKLNAARCGQGNDQRCATRRNMAHWREGQWESFSLQVVLTNAVLCNLQVWRIYYNHV